MSNTRHFTKESFHVKKVSIESAHEKNIRHGHIFILQFWWARRSLTSLRATNYAALIPAPENYDEWNKMRQFIIDLSIHWEETRPVEFEVETQSEVIYYAVDKQLSAKIQEFARGRGVSPDTFLNLWMQEKLQEQNA